MIKANGQLLEKIDVEVIKKILLEYYRKEFSSTWPNEYKCCNLGTADEESFTT